MINNDLRKLERLSSKIRQKTLISIFHAGSGHPGGSLSAVDLLVYLYFYEMNIANPFDESRDRFVLSKGHACPALYAVLTEKGFIKEKELKKLRKLDGLLQDHPEKGILGIETPSGSLGQGFSFALGVAFVAKKQLKNIRVYVLLGDGECNEGEVWEGAMFGAFHKLNNLVAVVDYNKLQSDNICDNVTALSPLSDKWKAFRWNVEEIDGHSFIDMNKAFTKARSIKDKPTCIIAHTVKGKGISFVENNPLWHGSRAPTEKELTKALKELSK